VMLQSGKYPTVAVVMNEHATATWVGALMRTHDCEAGKSG